MIKILVLGAGAQGGPCAAILAKQKDISEVRIADINEKLLSNVCNRVSSDKLIPLKIDASKTAEIIKAANGVDVIINLNLVEFNNNVLNAALEVGAHYVDTANDYSYLMQMVEGVKPLKYNNEFRDIGKTALMGCGLSPGITNILTQYLCDKMDEIEDIIIRIGVSSETSGNGEIVKVWAPTWSPEIALSDFAEKPMIYEHGKYKTVPIFSGHENYQFKEPVGDVLITSHSHEEPYTLPYFIDKKIKCVDFKFPIDPIAAAFVKMGFADDKEIDVKGIRIVPRDVLMQMVKRPSNAFLEESTSNLKKAKNMAIVLEINVEGISEGKITSRSISWKTTLDYKYRINLLNRVGTSYSRIALPSVVGAYLCINGDTESGVISSECLDTKKFLKHMTEMGCPIDFEERTVKQIRL